MANKILLTGATGYIGGTILHNLLACNDPAIQQAAVTVLVRGEQRARKLAEQYGSRIRCIQFKDWDETDFLCVLHERPAAFNLDR